MATAQKFEAEEADVQVFTVMLQEPWYSLAAEGTKHWVCFAGAPTTRVLVGDLIPLVNTRTIRSMLAVVLHATHYQSYEDCLAAKVAPKCFPRLSTADAQLELYRQFSSEESVAHGVWAVGILDCAKLESIVKLLPASTFAPDKVIKLGVRSTIPNLVAAFREGMDFINAFLETGQAKAARSELVASAEKSAALYEDIIRSLLGQDD